MTRHVWLVGVALAVIVRTGALAHADGNAAPGEPEVPAARPRLGLSMGLFSKFGEFGLEYSQPLGRTFEIGAGVGAAISGPQGFVMPRIHGGGRHFFDGGLGVSVGRFQELGICLSGPGDCGPTGSAVALWANFELGWTMTWDRSFVRIFGGAGRIVARGQCASGSTTCCMVETGFTLPSLGITGGMML